jgi:hypothetical protein
MGKKNGATSAKPKTAATEDLSARNLTLRIPGDELAALQIIAEKERVAVTHLLRRFAREGFAREKQRILDSGKERLPKELLPW